MENPNIEYYRRTFFDREQAHLHIYALKLCIVQKKQILKTVKAQFGIGEPTIPALERKIKVLEKELERFIAAMEGFLTD